MRARIIAAAEVYDALSSSRPYQEKLTPEQAVERMGQLSGSVLDPKVFEALSSVVARRGTLIYLDEGGGGGGPTSQKTKPGAENSPGWRSGEVPVRIRRRPIYLQAWSENAAART